MDFFSILVILLPVIAFLYASVGHGGASSYIIVLTLLNFAPAQVKSSALILNIIVSFIAFLAYRKVSYFDWKILLLLLLASVPASYLGGKIMLDAYWYRKLLGTLLFFPVIRFFGIVPQLNLPEVKPSAPKLLFVGAIIGFVSGIIGIGGGIILSPLLIIFKWSDIKQTAAISAAFIFFNSVAGLSGAGFSSIEFNPDLLILLPLTVVGGMIGAYTGAKKFKVQELTYILSLVLLMASVKLITG
jgi:uncharacterized membrane protein YfcA